MANEQNLTPFKEGEQRAKEAGSKGGKNKAGTKHISTHIQEMLNDPDFELKLKSGEILKGAPIIAIIKTAVAKSISGDTRAMEWLAKHGYGEKLIHEFENPIHAIIEKYGERGKVDDLPPTAES